MHEPKDDSGYNSNSVIVQDIFYFENSSDVHDEVSHISDLVSKSHIDESSKIKQPTASSSGLISSTPYRDLVDKFDQKLIEICTPTNRKRKKPSTFTLSDSDQTFHTDDEFEALFHSPAANRQHVLKTKCTRKLWVDFSDGSLSDTDLSSEKASKKLCLEGSRSEPNSPQRNFPNQSPLKNLQLGSAEKNEVLYPKICYKPKPKRYRISTPGQIRQRIKEKLLFENISDIRKPNQKLESFIRASNKVDFFTLFTVKSSNYHIIEHVLSYVEPKDLVSVYNVSKVARNCVNKNVVFNTLRKNHMRQNRINKENLCSVSSQNLSRIENEYSNISACSLLNTSDNLTASIGSLNLSHKCLKTNNSYGKVSNNLPARPSQKVSPRKREWLKFVEASADLTPGQKLTRCSRCSNPARIISHVIICTRRGCQFVCCSKCCDPLCLSVHYFEKYSDTENIPTTPEFLNSIPLCSNDVSNQDSWLKKRDGRLFLAECSNSNKKEETLVVDEAEILNNNNNSQSFCSIFNMNISESDKDKSLPKTVNDLIECKVKKLKKTVNSDLFFVPESPPKVSRPSTISSKFSKKNLRRL